MTILWDALVRVVRELDGIKQGTATGGSTTTLVDTARLEPDDYWNGGTLFILSGARKATSQIPTDWVLSTHILTIPADGIKVIAAGDTYLLMTRKWARGELVRAINVALTQQTIPQEDVSVAVDATAKAYDLPATVSGVMAVEIGDDTNGWDFSYWWEEVNHQVRFRAHAPTNEAQKLRLHFLGQHAAVSADTDEIDNLVDLDLLVFDALAAVHQMRFSLSQKQEAVENELMKVYQTLAMTRRATRLQPQPMPRYGRWG